MISLLAQSLPVLQILLFVCAFLLLGGLVAAFATRYKNVGPDELLIISGAKSPKNPKGLRFITGGSTIVMPVVEGYTIISLKPITVDVALDDIQIKGRQAATAQMTFQIRIGRQQNELALAATHFASSSPEEIAQTAKTNLEGSVIEAIRVAGNSSSTMTPQWLATEVERLAGPSLAKLGLELTAVNVLRAHLR